MSDKTATPAAPQQPPEPLGTCDYGPISKAQMHPRLPDCKNWRPSAPLPSEQPAPGPSPEKEPGPEVITQGEKDRALTSMRLLGRVMEVAGFRDLTVMSLDLCRAPFAALYYHPGRIDIRLLPPGEEPSRSPSPPSDLTPEVTDLPLEVEVALRNALSAAYWHGYAAGAGNHDEGLKSVRASEDEHKLAAAILRFANASRRGGK